MAARSGNPPPPAAASHCRVARAGAAVCAALLALVLPGAHAAGNDPAGIAAPSRSGASRRPSQSTNLAFRIDQGDQINAFLRSGDLAAQLVLRNGPVPRLVVAFPAGDSGIGVWLRASQSRPVHWRLLQAPRPLRLTDAHGRALRGLQVDLEADAPSLQLDQVLLSSVRVLRNYEAGVAVPRQVLCAPRIEGNRLIWARDRLDGAAGYRLSLEALDGARVTASALAAPRGTHQLHLRLQALSGEPPLTGLAASSLLRASAAPDQRERNIFSFLAYQQKYLAGAWRFDTYFGRDTLFSLLLLAPVLQPAAVSDGIDSVLARLSARGEVAHEEAIGEYAVLLNEAAGRVASAAPVYDYSMVDEDFLLAPLVARWLLGTSQQRTAAAAFLAARDSRGERRGDALLRNLRFIVLRTRPFARAPTARNLIGLKPGQRAGDWRDSDDGLDGGRYPFDVNVVLAPAALQATQRLFDSGLLRPYLSGNDTQLLAQAGMQWRIWQQSSAPLFRIELERPVALAHLHAYAHALGLDGAPAAATLHGATFRFEALSLDGNGRALPVMQSDVAMQLLLSDPDAAALGAALDTLMRPFPAGLMTPIGLLIANPAFADAQTQRRFTRDAYHGTVVWAWQQAMLLAGIARQLQRRDLPASLRERLTRAHDALWQAIDRAGAFRGAELWSWSYAAGKYRLQPFHPPGPGEAESNAAQLWSTVLLALQR
ncbi:MAG TPA: hypothetical protein VN660_00850 [Steroidobacteraceae bacterium]|nr:hypothetical protein [Steroidobacteraceae bacterium]